MKYVLWIILAPLCLLLLFTALLIISSLFADRHRQYTEHSPYFRRLLNTATGLCLLLGRIHLHVTGMEKVPEGTRFLLVSNHRSKFDPITTWYAFRKYDVAFISKKENFEVPCFGRIIRKCCFMDIDRENPREAIKTINLAAELMEKDTVSVGLYPEGTRNFGPGLLPFHNGTFKIAKKAGAPIVIMSISGADEIKSNYPLRPSHVFIDVLETLTPAQVSAMSTAEIGEEAGRLMEESLYKRGRTNENGTALQRTGG
ncbi:MAG: 1-acyl-sn-glycerol-3-phosphate acyltransferase [Oscillospiraceae bacterium]|nr:1-acyl-sn-glycerol-3-phosphate acyltransferase [Oscillospiraceae bacterium]